MTHLVLDLSRRLATFGRRRVAAALALNVTTGLTEGVAVMALVPLLRLFGVDGSSDPGTNPDHGPLALGLAGYVVLVGVAAMMVRARTLAVNTLTYDFLDRLRTDLHKAVLQMEWRAFHGTRAADLQQTITGEIGRIHVAVVALGDLVGALLIMPFLALAALVLSPPLTFVAILVVGIAALITRPLGRRGWQLGMDLGAANRAAMADVVDTLAGHRLIKLFAAEDASAKALEHRFAAVRANQQTFHRAQATEQVVLRIIAAMAVAGGMYAALVQFGLSIAESLVLMLAYGRLLQAALRCLSGWRRLSAAGGALKGYDDTLAACRAGAEPASDGPAQVLKRDIRLSAVTVRHGGSGQEGFPEGGPEEWSVALHHVDAVIPAGQITAVIGASGAGKSTLVDTILGLIPADEGQILIDGVPLSGSTRRAWRQATSACPQDPFLFHDTLRANLCVACPGADDATLWLALEQASAAGFVRALPMGLNTVAGDRGARFSGGERQRLALARALLRQPSLLVLDEATAALDDESAAMITATVRGLRGRVTVLVVAHRLATVASADHVLVLDAGRVFASGSWDAVRQQAGPRLAALGMLETITPAEMVS